MCLLCLTCQPVPSDRADDEIPALIERAISEVKPALVRIKAVNTDYYQGRARDKIVFGSGVIIREEGFIVTNHHVAGKAKRLTCVLADREEVKGELVGTDPMSDIAVIKLVPEEERTFPSAEFPDACRLKVGDRVLAMGSPYAFSQSVTMGIVSNLNLVMPVDSRPFDTVEINGEDVGSLVRWIGHDAAIYRGNSGGPLVDLEGKIVGINEIAMGLGGAIPADLAQDVARQLIEHGEVRRSWLGLRVQPLLKSSGRKTGALVSGVVADSPADKAVFLPGDILKQLDGNPVNIRFSEEIPVFNRMVADIPVGKEIEAVILRGNGRMVLNLTTIKREPSRFRTREFPEWGMAGRNIAGPDARSMKRDSRDGVLVVTVRPGWASDRAKPEIVRNDIITQVANENLKNVEHLEELTGRLTRDNDSPVPALVGFERKGAEHLTVISLGIPRLEDSGLEVPRAWIPADTQVLTRDMAEKLNVPDLIGVRVTRVYPDYFRAGNNLRVGDLIIALNGERIDARNPRDSEVFPSMVRRYAIGEEVELTVVRGSREVKTVLSLPPSPKSPGEMKKYRDDNLGFTARDMTFQDADPAQEPEEGVVVELVETGSWAALGHLARGDVIIEVDGNPSVNVSVLESLMEAIERKKPEAVVFQVRRGIYLLYLEFEPLWP